MDEELFVWALIGVTGSSLPNLGSHSSHQQPMSAPWGCQSLSQWCHNSALLSHGSCWARAAPGVPSVLPLAGAVGSALVARLCPAAQGHPTPQGDVSYGCTPLSAASSTSSSHWIVFKKYEMQIDIYFYQKGQHKAHLGILFHLLHEEDNKTACPVGLVPVFIWVSV